MNGYTPMTTESNATSRPASPDLLVEVVDSQEMLDLAYSVRLDVFVLEQKVPVEEEIDSLDTAETTVHVIARRANEPGRALGTARLLPTVGEPGHFHIGRVAVRAEARGLRVGAALMSALEQRAVADTPDCDVTVELSAQEQALPFYERIGYSIASEARYLDAGIWHRDMVKVIARA